MIIWLSRLVLFCVGIVGIVLLACQVEPSPSSLDAHSQLPTTSSNHVRTQQNKSGIIGGKKDNRHPEVGALASNQRPFCTGTLIARRVVLTAAHCVDAANGYLRGNAKLQFRIDLPDPKGKDGYTSKFYDFDTNLMLNHPKWNKKLSNGADVALVILKEKVTEVKPMPHNASPLNSSWQGRQALFLGYGLIQSTPRSVSANRKYGTNLPIVKIVADRFVHQASGRSVCHGDSGGPAIGQFNGRMKVFGVNSYVSAPRVPGTTRSSCTGSGTSMRTDTYNAFIQSILVKYGDGPETCTLDTDCGGCARCDTTKKVCEPKVIKQPPSNCKPCRSDKDCQGGHCYRFSNGYRCLQTCSSDGCCPSNTFCDVRQTSSGLRKLCVPFETVCPDLSCKTSKDCGLGEVCENSKCMPSPVGRSSVLCLPCKEDKDCQKSKGDKHSCLEITGVKRCTQPCGKGDFCPAGFTCKEPSPGLPRQCVPNNNNCEIPCMFSSHCPKGQRCFAGICTKDTGAEEGDPCDPAPCKESLECATTIVGKRCLKPCGVPPGYGGSSCINGNGCHSGMGCYALQSEARICLKGCRTSLDCNAGGGNCYQGVCMCQINTHCASGYFCNKSVQGIGACAPKDKLRTCEANVPCSPLNGLSYCLKPKAGNRGQGQSCDAVNQCLPGLSCIQTQDGGVCFEKCDYKTPCRLGGTCALWNNGLRICLCQEQSDCHGGRQCQLYLGRHGLCQPQGLTNTCLSHKECPKGSGCLKGKCVSGAQELPEPEMPNTEPKAEKPQEKAEEKTPEASTQPDAGPEEASPPEPKKTPEAKAELKKEAPVTDLTQPEAKDGCGCSTAPGSPSYTSFLLWLLFLLPVIRKRARLPLHTMNNKVSKRQGGHNV